MQRCDHVKALGHGVGTRGFGHRHVQEMHALEAQLGRQLLRGLNQGRAGFNTVDMALRLGLEVQVIQDEAQVGLASAMVGQCEGLAALPQLLQDGFDELVQVVDLLELAARVLVELAVARQDVQRLEQLNTLSGLQIQLRGNILRRWFGCFAHACRSRSLGHFVVLRHYFFSCAAAPTSRAAMGQRAPTSRSSQPSIPISCSTCILRS